jgi:hypothetical protein
MLANLSISNTTPRPDYYMIQDQYVELDDINNRISQLVKACKVVGVYDQSAIGVSRMLTEGFDNELIPVDNWAMFAEKGGLKGQIDWLPLDMIIAALEQLNAAREVIKGQIYELTGIADIVRGASKASETLGAQQIKAQFASVRIKKLQDEVARFATDIMRIKAELMVKHFDPEILLQKSNIMSTGEANSIWIAPAMELLTSEEGFEWRVTVNADTLAQADYAMEKQDRIELLTTMSGFMEKSLPMIQTYPASATLMVSMMKWAISGFKNADEIEGMLDKELTALEEAAQQPPPSPPPDPEVQKAQAQMEQIQAKGQLDQQKAEIDMQAKQQEVALKERLGQMEIQMKMMELKFKEQELQMEAQKAHQEMRFEEEQAAISQRTKLMESELGLKAQADQHEQQSQFSQEDHAAQLQQQKAAAAAKPKPSGGEK